MKYLAIIFLATLCVAVQAQDLATEFGRITEPLKGKIAARYFKLQELQPGAKGKVKFALYIDGRGDLTGCRVKYSDLNNPEFEQSICDLFKTLNYSAMSVKSVEFVSESQFYSVN